MSRADRTRFSRLAACLPASVRGFFRHLADVVFPTPQKDLCPHCGGLRCFGVCSLPGDKDGRPKTPGAVSPEAR